MKTKKSHLESAQERQKRGHRSQATDVSTNGQSLRNAQLDTLRGIAIVLMIVDHAADMIWKVPIEVDTLRIATRLSMPLFCVLAGYFLYRPRLPRPERIFQLAAATLAANVVYWTLYARLEILASILLTIGVYLLVRRWMPLCMGLVILAWWDPTGAILDYPLLVVAACIAAGTALRWAEGRDDVRHHGTNTPMNWRHGVALLAWIAMAAASLSVPKPTAFVLWFVPLAGLLTLAAAHHRLFQVRALAWLGRFPLMVYVVQYYLLWGISALVHNG